ncbi:MAG: hypothetical protein KDI75_01825 [Xanthomonadales bacterium]|nr:hypothetical protein [Xanthomonadales bacterium]
MLDAPALHRISVRCACSALLTLMLIPVLASAARPQLEIRPRNPTSTTPVLIDLIGHGTDVCAPQSASLTADGRDISIVLDHGARCKATREGYRLHARPAKGLLRWNGSGVHRIRLYDHGDPGGARRLLGFQLVEIGRYPLAVARPETGFWWVESGGDFGGDSQGMGLSIERQGDLISASVMGYDADGEPEWLMGAGEIEGSIAEIALTRFQGGRGPFETSLSPGNASIAGKLDLQFLDPARAIAWFSRPTTEGGISLQPMSLVRFRFDSDPAAAWLGRWILLPEHPDGKNASSLPQLIEFDDTSQHMGGFSLIDGKHGFVLACEQDAARPNSPPVRCVLNSADGKPLADFGSIAVNSLSGWETGSGRLRAVHDTDSVPRRVPLLPPGY